MTDTTAAGHDAREVTDLDPHPDDAATVAFADLPHCKDVTHVNVAVLGAHETVRLTATHVDHLACKNTGYTGPGVILSKRSGHPLDGLHLLPDLIAELPGWLRDGSQLAHGLTGVHTVAINHTSRKVYELFAALTPDEAVITADAIDAAA